MWIKFLESGESPEIGAYKKGDERDLPADIAKVFIARGIVIVSGVKQFPTKKIKEEHENGQ